MARPGHGQVGRGGPGHAVRSAVLGNLFEITEKTVEDREWRERVEARLDEQEEDSFPASDPHSDWAGPPVRPPGGASG